MPETVTVACHLIDRLAEIGIQHLNAPRDFNLIFLDTVVADPGIECIRNATELNAAKACTYRLPTMSAVDRSPIGKI